MPSGKHYRQSEIEKMSGFSLDDYKGKLQDLMGTSSLEKRFTQFIQRRQKASGIERKFDKYLGESVAIAAKFMGLLESEDPGPINVGFYSADIRALTLKFRQCLAITAKGDRYPCVISTNELPVPVDFLQSRATVGLLQQLLRTEEIGDLPSEQSILTDIGEVRFTSNADAKQRFFLGLISFISGRLGDYHSGRAPSARCGMGVHLTITTITQGLEVHCTPEFFESWRHFGSPTSPVDDCIQPGLYHFKALEWNSATASYIPRYETTAARYIGGTQKHETLPV